MDCRLPFRRLDIRRFRFPTFLFWLGLRTLTTAKPHFTISTTDHSSSSGLSTRPNIRFEFSCVTSNLAARQVHFPFFFSRQYNFISIHLYSMTKYAQASSTFVAFSSLPCPRVPHVPAMRTGHYFHSSSLRFVIKRTYSLHTKRSQL